jgi:hypothetical protein
MGSFQAMPSSISLNETPRGVRVRFPRTDLELFLDRITELWRHPGVEESLTVDRQLKWDCDNI